MGRASGQEARRAFKTPAPDRLEPDPPEPVPWRSPVSYSPSASSRWASVSRRSRRNHMKTTKPAKTNHSAV